MTPAEPSPLFRLKSANVNASAQVRNGEFTVLAGSEARTEGTATFDEQYRALRQRLIDSGQLVSSDSPAILTFAQDVNFETTRQATIVILMNQDVPSPLWATQDTDGRELTFEAWKQSQKVENPVFQLMTGTVHGEARVRDGRFVVLAGSQARPDAVPSFTNGYAARRQALIDAGTLPLDETAGVRTFKEDVEFDGGTAAAAVILGRNANGFKEWWYTDPQGQRVSYETWWWVNSQGQSPATAEQETVDASWIPLFHELAVKLLEYQERQPELIQVLREAGVNIQHDEDESLAVLDPFSFFSLILKHQSDARVKEILTVIRQRLELQEAVPDDLVGVPWSNPMNAWFFAYRSVRQPSDLATLWALARQTVVGQLDPQTFEQALAIHKVALPKLTQGLFWLNPNAFLPLNGINVPYLEQRRVPGASKVTTLAEFERILTAARPIAPDFPTLSHLAWLAAQKSKSEAQLNGEAFPFTQFRDEAEQYLADTPKGNMLLDRRYAPLLISLMDDEVSPQLRPFRSPYSGKAQLAVKVGLTGSVRGESSPFARALLIPTEVYQDYQPIAQGLTLEAGLPDGRGDEARVGLQDDRVRHELLLALLAVPEGSPKVIFNLNSDFPGIGSLTVNSAARPALQNALDTYAQGIGKARRIRVGISLTPEQLESSVFPELLEGALSYVGRITQVLERAVQVLPPAAPVLETLPALPPSTPAARNEPLPFVPVPGVPLNQILYGPPGTGKTYRVVDEALSVLDPDFLRAHPAAPGRAARKARYDELVLQNRISFVTFHQSFGYEDFIEGIKPVMAKGQLSYRLQDGVFLEAVRSAGGELPRVVDDQPQVSVPDVLRPDGQVWRLYIDGAVPISQVRDRSVSRGEMRIGSWGKSPQDLVGLPDDDLTAQQLLFRSGIRVGDLVLLATGIDRIGAVGVMTGEYHFDPKSETIFALDYTHVRSVHWLARGLNVSAQEVTGKQFSPPTLQRVAGVDPATVLDRLHLDRKIDPEQPAAPAVRPYVLIIDEINRGNVAKIFGELITLLESGKRAGASEALSATLPLSRRPLSVPQSLYVIGTMNTADRSLTLLDSALRRRFAFRPVWPQPEVLPVLVFEDGTALDLRKFLFAVNARIERLLSREQVIGHAYLLDLPEDARLEDVALALKERILPLLEEYFFDDWGKIREVLGDDKKEKDESLQFVRRQSVNGDLRYWVNEEAFRSAEAFSLVYSQLDDAVFKFSS